MKNCAHYTHVPCERFPPQTDVASSLTQRPSRNVTKQLHSSRTTSDTTTARNTLTLTAHEIDMLPGAHHHCHSMSSHSATHRIARRINCALSNDKRHAATSASPMTVTHPPIYKSGRLSNVTSSLSQRPSRSVTKQLRPLERRATLRQPETFPY